MPSAVMINVATLKPSLCYILSRYRSFKVINKLDRIIAGNFFFVAMKRTKFSKNNINFDEMVPDLNEWFR
jgi:hypothetical protein